MTANINFIGKRIMNKREFTVMVDGMAEYSVAFLRDSGNWHIYDNFRVL